MQNNSAGERPEGGGPGGCGDSLVECLRRATAPRRALRLRRSLLERLRRPDLDEVGGHTAETSTGAQHKCGGPGGYGDSLLECLRRATAPRRARRLRQLLRKCLRRPDLEGRRARLQPKGRGELTTSASPALARGLRRRPKDTASAPGVPTATPPHLGTTAGLPRVKSAVPKSGIPGRRPRTQPTALHPGCAVRAERTRWPAQFKRRRGDACRIGDTGRPAASFKSQCRRRDPQAAGPARHPRRCTQGAPWGWSGPGGRRSSKGAVEMCTDVGTLQMIFSNCKPWSPTAALA